MYALGHLGQVLTKFSAVKDIDRANIVTRPDLFQGRETAFSQETVDKIVREGFDKSQEPIAVWQDPKTGEYIVISGHSRWHASELLWRKGDRVLATMPVKIFQGSLDEAQDYAILESNRSGTAEGLKSDLKAYRRAIGKGKNKEYLLGIFKTESMLRKLQDLSHLDPNGRFMEYMDTDAAKSFPYLERNAQWVGMLRKIYPQLTNSHEKELFAYMYTSGKASEVLNLTKERFVNTVEKRVTAMLFDPNSPLNLNNMPSTSAYTGQVKEALAIAERELDQLHSLRYRKEELIKGAIQQGKTNLADQFRLEYDALNRQILAKLLEIDKIKADGKMMERTITHDLFSMAASGGSSGSNPAPRQRSDTKAQERAARLDTLKAKARQITMVLSVA